MKTYEPLLAWLCWKPDAAAHLQEFRDTRLTWLASQLGAALSTAARQSDEIATLWAALSSQSVARLLRAPIICQALRVGEQPSVLHRLLMAEYILDQRPDMQIDHWSALGDVWLGNVALPSLQRVLNIAEDGRYRSPSLACGIPIDLSLPADIAYPGAGVSAPQHANAQETAASVARLNKAVAHIAATSPAMHEAVIDLVSNIILRTDHSAPHRLQSASSAAALGRVVLINAHANQISEALLAETLIHEATHTAISTVELTAPLVSDAACLARCRIASPWTGASLPVHAFLHACLVWLALSGFWARMHQTSEAAERSAFIRRGFGDLQPDAVLAPYADRLLHAALPLLNAAREKALA